MADKYIYCLGAFGLELLKGIHIETGIFPTLGASVSVPVDERDPAAKISLTDTDNRMVYSRIGKTFRAAGGICANKVKGIEKKMGRFIRKRIRESFLSYGNIERAIDWQNYRPTRPDSTPLICNVKKYGNLYLNTGHGHLGWTMSLGSAEIIRRLIAKENLDKFSFLEKEI